jgi:hypothetical protein
MASEKIFKHVSFRDLVKHSFEPMIVEYHSAVLNV